jgi:putative aminopeptidase FrvX
MPKYTVEALEKFVVKTTYVDVEAESVEEAEKLVKAGKVAYDSKEIQEGDEEYLETLSIDPSR